VKGPDAPDEGYVQAEISFDGIPRAFDTSFRYKKELPNGSDFIIFGQRNFIECIETTSTPKSFEGGTLAGNVNRYGSLAFLRYYDPVDMTVTLL